MGGSPILLTVALSSSANRLPRMKAGFFANAKAPYMTEENSLQSKKVSLLQDQSHRIQPIILYLRSKGSCNLHQMLSFENGSEGTQHKGPPPPKKKSPLINLLSSIVGGMVHAWN